MKLPALILPLFILALLPPAFAQTLPGKIRGYKLYNANITVNSPSNAGGKAKADAVVVLGKPTLVALGLTGLTFEIGADIRPVEQTGRIDFLTFKDFRINNIAVEIDEYNHSFAFKKDSTFALPVPARVFVRSSSIAKGAFKALIESKKEWTVSGTVFIFGTFKKFGMSFKRVIPVRVDLKIASPVGV